MERTIIILKELLEKNEQLFIENSIDVYMSMADAPVPDTKANLGIIIELKQAISILEKSITKH